MTAATRRFRGRPTEFDIFEGYVTYKIVPFLDGRSEEILAQAETAEGTEVESALVSFGRDCALTGALALAAAVNRAMIGEDSDIVFADACLAAYFILTDPFKTTRNTRIMLSTHFRRFFGQDIDYLILSPEREILHLKRKGWPAMVARRDATQEPRDPDFYVDLLARVSAARLNANWHPYDDLESRPPLKPEAQEFFDENLDALRLRNFPKLTAWVTTARQARATLQARGIAFWAN
ncbi:hypothetical protein [Paenirhodobacter populi]|uniref:hypothetical protein n=1 Tax=Paenirhodobacter populi TaxID=2306993 RepID=UPI000FE32AB2|nr:hypothetical protein [Sinirhodobacter populi]RWR06857.1 hypothetical protein D2T32_12905 [Sinirhodobacter populi]